MITLDDFVKGFETEEKIARLMENIKKERRQSVKDQLDKELRAIAHARLADLDNETNSGRNNYSENGRKPSDLNEDEINTGINDVITTASDASITALKTNYKLIVEGEIVGSTRKGGISEENLEKIALSPMVVNKGDKKKYKEIIETYMPYFGIQQLAKNFETKSLSEEDMQRVVSFGTERVYKRMKELYLKRGYSKGVAELSARHFSDLNAKRGKINEEDIKEGIKAKQEELKQKYLQVSNKKELKIADYARDALMKYSSELDKISPEEYNALRSTIYAGVKGDMKYLPRQREE